jgi:hypothetical protein
MLKPKVIWWIGIAFLFFACVYLIRLSADELTAFWSVIGFVIGIAGGLAFFWFLIPWILVQHTVSVWRARKLLGRHRVLITPDALIHDYEIGTGRTLWAAVNRIVATKDYVFIYFAGNTVLLVPRRAFADENQFVEFVSTAKRFHEEGIEKGS